MDSNTLNYVGASVVELFSKLGRLGQATFLLAFLAILGFVSWYFYPNRLLVESKVMEQQVEIVEKILKLEPKYRPTDAEISRQLTEILANQERMRQSPVRLLLPDLSVSNYLSSRLGRIFLLIVVPYLIVGLLIFFVTKSAEPAFIWGMVAFALLSWFISIFMPDRTPWLLYLLAVNIHLWVLFFGSFIKAFLPKGKSINAQV